MKTLNISTSRASLDISSTRAQLDIRNNVPRRFQMKTTRPQMEVTRQTPQMKVNWKKVWADRGIRSPEYFRQYTMQLARQMTREAVQKIVDSGDALGALEQYFGTSQNPVGEWAYGEMMGDIPEMQMSSALPSPEVEWTEGVMKIEWSPGDVEIIWNDDFMPDIMVTPHSVEIRLGNHSEVKITVNEDNIPQKSGKKVDKKI